MRQIKYRDAIREAMSEEMRKDPTIFLMGEEVAEYNGAYKVSQGMLDEFGAKRVIDTPIAELGFTAIGVGAAANGTKPIIEFMTWNFAILAFDQIINGSADENNFDRINILQNINSPVYRNDVISHICWYIRILTNRYPIIIKQLFKLIRALL
jgi:pyruvate/2-oxoglutarate/acetoin dehydrogenase E1 component